MKTLVMGDIHGAYKAMLQCFERCGFDAARDLLIVLGDVCDGYPHVNACIDALLGVKHCRYILGNHDLWALKWAQTGWKEDVWLSQGGKGTIASYGGNPMPKPHVDFLRTASFWFACEDRIFVHGGFDHRRPIQSQPEQELAWDRTLIEYASGMSRTNPDHLFGGFKEIYIGHTPVTHLGSTKPLKLCNVWDLDTGAGWGGRLSVMDVQSKQYWQSDPTSQLYPGLQPRG
ncbi:MAG: metallophosphoesterase [Candidatus Omnitrophica bacterium]|nr:metallophosphoesterase [Candidatus Omnitrophota bacterium]